jgi:hypothetical protein
LNVWTRPDYFDVDGLIDAFGNCLAISSKAHSQLWPDAAMWMADHSSNRLELL